MTLKSQTIRSFGAKNKVKQIIFFGNGPLADYALAVLERECQIVFHARKKEDLEEVKKLKPANPDTYGVLASFGVMIKSDVLELFEPEGILNIHPSLLPSHRGASPIETAILNGDTDFSVSVMKLVKAMDAGPVYYQTTLSGADIAKQTDSELISGLIPSKTAIYQALAETGAEWICNNLGNLPKPTSQDDKKATFCQKFAPETDTAEQTLRKIVAFQGFPKSKFTFYGQNCIVLESHILRPGETAVLTIPCADGLSVAIDKLQPEGRKAMDAKAFLNGYGR